MTLRIAINGFGRIGRLMARLLIERTSTGEVMRLKAIVVRPGGEGDLEKRASLFASDSVHGAFQGTLRVDNDSNSLIANGNVNGVDVNYFDSKLFTKNKQKSLRRSLGINETDFVFIFVGRLVGDKGINELIEAFKQLIKQFSGSKLILVGPYEEKLDPLRLEILNEISQNNNIITVGFFKKI